MDIVKIKTNENNVFCINASRIKYFMYVSSNNTTFIYVDDSRFTFEGDKTKELVKMLTMVNEGHLMVMGEEWTERSL